MRLPVNSISQVIAAFVEQDLLPKGTKLQQWATVFFTLALGQQAQTLVSSPALRTLGLVDDEGIDIEKVRDLALEAFAKSGPLEVAGIILGREDVPVIYEIAKKYAKEQSNV